MVNSNYKVNNNNKLLIKLISVAIKSGIFSGNRCFYSPRQTVRSRAMSKVVKFSIYKIVVKPVVCGSNMDYNCNGYGKTLY